MQRATSLQSPCKDMQHRLSVMCVLPLSRRVHYLDSLILSLCSIFLTSEALLWWASKLFSSWLKRCGLQTRYMVHTVTVIYPRFIGLLKDLILCRAFGKQCHHAFDVIWEWGIVMRTMWYLHCMMQRESPPDRNWSPSGGLLTTIRVHLLALYNIGHTTEQSSGRYFS